MLVPVTVSAPPLSALAKVTVLPLVSNVAPPEPIAANRAEMSVVLPAAHCSPPPFRLMVPLPRLPATKLTRPPVTVVAPV